MDNNAIPKVKTVHIMLLGMDERQYAMFRMAFKMHGTTNYELVTADQGITPEMVLVDADQSANEWTEAKGRFPEAKVVYFATTPPQVTAPYLAKPIKFDTLFANLKNLQQGNGVWIARSGSTPASQAAEPVIATHANAARATVAPLSLSHFDPDEGLLGAVRKATAQDNDVAVLHAGKPILLVFPSIQKVLLAVDSASLKGLCEQKFTDLSVRPVAEEHLKAKAKLSTTACLWQMAIWTSNGRLPKVIDAHTVFKVKSWPNLTRLAPLAESMRLSAFLTKASASLGMLHKLMVIENKDLADYLSAAYVAGYLNIEAGAAPATSQMATAAPRPVQTTASAAATTQPKSAVAATDTQEEAAPQQRGLLQRLMNKIIGR